MFHKLRWRIAIPYVALILAATLGLTLYISDQVSQARLEQLESQLWADARLLADSVQPLLAAGEGGETLDPQARKWAELLDARVTLIGADGVVLGDSHAVWQEMDNHLNRPEVQEALARGHGQSTRYSNTMGFEMMYSAVPVAGSQGGDPLGIVRVSLSVEEIKAGISRLRHSIGLAGLVVALVAAVIALIVADRTTRPVRHLTEAAEAMAAGDLSARLLPASKDEIGQLTESFHRMASQLRIQMATLAEEQSRLAAVLDHMADGVLITDEDSHVRLMNAAAARLFNSPLDDALGRTFAQVVPHHQMIELWKRCRDQGEEQAATVEVSPYDLFLQAIITPFEEAEARSLLIIVQDLTRVRRLETVRRDFISNISHELRTPLAGLKALVDTLRAGAIKDPPAAKRFLKRMDSEVDSLTHMVQELLELSRVESGQAPLRLEPVPAAEIIAPPADRLRPQAERAGLTLVLSLDPQLPLVMADAEQAHVVVTNLVHNAIKFTAPGGKVTVGAERNGDEVTFSVSDSGVGIPAEDVSRIFERFYKADRARSGGGTGLGLAIAKHVIQGHGGRIWAESVEGEGSTFFFTLPIVESP
jgi:two-component system phosphate regulon sensor histidine kinase PhoR